MLTDECSLCFGLFLSLSLYSSQPVIVIVVARCFLLFVDLLFFLFSFPIEQLIFLGDFVSHSSIEYRRKP